jgi:hypothetical protein
MSKPVLMSISAALCLLTEPASADELRDIQLRRLLEPTQAELAQEEKGRIYIYESLTNQDISHAMEEEFERVESMMFIRVPKTDASGEVMKDPGTGEAMVEDDGC